MATTRLTLGGNAAAYQPFLAKTSPEVFTGVSLHVSGLFTATIMVQGLTMTGLQVSSITGVGLTITNTESV